MNLRLTYPAPILLLALLGPACVIDPSVLEGESDTAGDELGDASDASDGGGDTTSDTGTSDTGTSDADTSDTADTGAPVGSECEQGTNLQGGSDPGEFPVGQCPGFACAEGWGHGEVDQLPIAWTREFPRDVDEQAYVPAGMMMRDGDLLVVARHDAGADLLRVSSEGDLLDTHAIPTPWFVSTAVARDQGPIYLSAFDEALDEGHILGVTELGELLWSYPAFAMDMQAMVGGGLLVVTYDDGQATLLELSDAGEVEWTLPTLFGGGLAVAPSGRIVVTGGHDINDPVYRVRILQPDGTLVGETTMPAEVSDPYYGLLMLDNTRMLGLGVVYGDFEPDAAIAGFDLEGPSLEWSHTYARATHNCFAGMDAGWINPTYEHFNAMALLPDGSVLIAATEETPSIDPLFVEADQPRVLHITPQGELLAADRGLWLGHASRLATSPDGSAYAAIPLHTQQSSEVHNDGFYIRKYLP